MFFGRLKVKIQIYLNNHDKKMKTNTLFQISLNLFMASDTLNFHPD